MTADAQPDGLHPDADAPGDQARLGPYRLVQRLGEGGMGVVHLALDRQGRAVAIKLLRPHVAADPGARARLAREVDTLSRIRSPFVAPVIDADVDGETPYVVTRYVDGPALDEHVGRRGLLPPPELHRLAAGLAEALDAIHSAGVVHRDVKPGNVLLVERGDPVLIDFGIAHLVDDVRLTSTGLVMGTPGYLAPEVVHGDDVTPATDWWGWAATTAYAASGTPPFGGGGMNAVLARVAAGEPDLVAVDPRIEPLLYAALSPNPDERPHQVEVVRALEQYAHGEPVTEVLQVRRSQPETVALDARRTAALPVDAPPPPTGPAVPGPPPGPSLQPLPPPPVPERDAWRGEDDEPDEGEERPLRPPGVDPRIGLETRSGTLLALLALVAGAAAAAPLLALGALFLWVVLARTSDRSITSLVMRRHQHGQRGSDVAVAVASSPWHLVVGLVGAVITVALPLLVGVSAMFSGALVLGALTGQPARPDAVPALLGAGVFLALTAWWGPGGSSLRRGSRSLVRGVTRHPTVRQAIVVLALLSGAILVAVTITNGAPTWAPLPSAPSWVDEVGFTL